MTTVISGSFPAVNSDSDATINGLTVGKGGGANAFATAIGNGALAATNSGSVLAVGYETLASNTTGDDITAVGSYRTLYTNTTGSYLVAVGRQALGANTTASFNTAIGHKSSFSNTTGANNSSLGYHSLFSNTTGSTNVGLGQEALYSNTTASNNTAVGFQAGYTNVTGAGNAFFGTQAGYLSTGSYNAFLGAYAGYNSTGSGNTFVGINSTTGNGAGYNMTTGSDNTILGGYNGNQGDLDIRTASNYIVLSDGDGNPRLYWDSGNTRWVSSAGNIAIGNTTNFIQTNNIQSWSTGTALIVKNGSGGVQLTSGSTAWASASDINLKNVTGIYTNALQDIAQIEPIKFTWKSDKLNVPQVGLSAQSIQKVIPEAISTFKNDGDDTEYLAVRYTELIPLMIASIKELNAKVTALEAQLGAK
jgi:hypothetical protein